VSSSLPRAHSAVSKVLTVGMLRVALTRSNAVTRHGRAAIPAWSYMERSFHALSSGHEKENNREKRPMPGTTVFRPTSLSRVSTQTLSMLTARNAMETKSFLFHMPSSSCRWLTTDASSSSSSSLNKKTNIRRRNTSKIIHEQETRLDKALEKVGESRGFHVKDFSLQNLDTKVSQKALTFVKSVPALSASAVKTIIEWMRICIQEPGRAKAWFKETREHIGHELKHYWIGTKLLYADVTTSTRILRRVVRGNALTRRERKQLQRTVADLLRLIPFAFFVIVPFMEFLLPFALKMFPNMLPSTYKHNFQREEDMKRQLQLRVSLAEFLQETVKEVMQDYARDGEHALTEDKKLTAMEVMNFIERAQRGAPLSSDETLKIASLFNDEVTLDNISRPQLVGMCRYMGVNPYGNDNFLRFQLRMKIKALKKDDQEIIWEGLDSLNKEELQVACMERGMRATGLTKTGYVKQMRQV
jgi:LETM1 and EF-hand domain-containing protein 1